MTTAATNISCPNSTPTFEDQQQRKDEQQVVDSKQDVFDNESGVDPNHIIAGCFCSYLEAGISRRQSLAIEHITDHSPHAHPVGTQEDYDPSV